MVKRSSRILSFKGDKLHVICKTSAAFKAVRYLYGNVYQLDIQENDFMSNKKLLTINAISDGFYLLYNDYVFKVYQKGTLDRMIFVRKFIDEESDTLSLGRYDASANHLGMIEANRIVDNIYAAKIPTDDFQFIEIGDYISVCDKKTAELVSNSSNCGMNINVRQQSIKPDIIRNDKIKPNINNSEINIKISQEILE